MIGCNYIASAVPFDVPDGYSFCFLYCVFCADSSFDCPFNFLPDHLVTVDEFGLYPSKKRNSIQLELF